MQSLLHLLLKISESVTRLESLLSITSSDQVAKERIEINDVNFPTYSSHMEDSSDERLVSCLLSLYIFTFLPFLSRIRGNRAKHLGRVAVEYTQLLYHVHKAEAENCSFITEVQWVC